jgi:hypothetical protein
VARSKVLQTNFSAGELSEDLGMRQDTEQYVNGARSLRNRRCMIGGGTKRRPGSWNMVEILDGAVPRSEDFVVDRWTQYVLVFTAGKMAAYVRDPDTGDLTAAGTLTSAPWIGNIAIEMDYEQSADVAFVTHQLMPTKVIVRTGASTWSLQDFSFHESGPRIEQPYLKLAAAAVTLTPSAVTGSIALVASAPHFISAHVGTRFRYLGREMEITAVSNSQNATATVHETLPATNTLTVGSSAGFTVNETVTGGTTGAVGIITSIPDATHLTIVSTNQIAFAGTESVIGPYAFSAMSGTAGASPASVTDWDEQLFGPANGYPGCVTLHRGRLLFGGHLAAPKALMGSKVGNISSFDVGDGSDADGFLEEVGDARASVIQRMYSAEQLIVATDRGLYYCPESVANPFRPTSIAFFPFGSDWPITAAKPRAFDDGVLFLSNSLIIKARPTGDQTRSWAADEISLISSHLVNEPTWITVTSNFAGGSERYAIIGNSDGTLAVLQLVEAQRIRNMVPWDTDGVYTSGCSIGRDVYVTTTRTVNGTSRNFLELFDQDLTLDLAAEYETEAELTTGVPAAYGSSTINVVSGRYHLGTFPLHGETVPAGPFIAGLYYDSVLELLPPVIEDDEGAGAGNMMRVVRIEAHVRASQRFAANGRTLSAYQVTTDVDAEPDEKNGWQDFGSTFGWSKDPTVTFNQPDPLPLDILAVRTTVAI